jgi:hypothetical protein
VGPRADLDTFWKKKSVLAFDEVLSVAQLVAYSMYQDTGVM